MKSLGVFAALLMLAAAAHTARAQETTVRWYGHAAFSITTPRGAVLLIDPWLRNPLNPDAQGGKDPLAARSVGARLAVPQHYATFPGIAANADEFAAELRRLKIPFHEMKPGETLTFRGRRVTRKN